MNALTFIDEIIGCLCKDGLAVSGTKVLVPNERLPVLQPVFLSLGFTLVSQDFLPGMSFWNIGGTVVPHALKLSRAYYEVLLDSYPMFLGHTLISQLEAFQTMASWCIDDFVVNAKYFTAYGLARFLKNAPPTRPSSFLCHPSLFSGRLRRFYKNRLVSWNKRNLSFFLSLLQGVKRGAETVPESFVRKALLKHRATLSQSYSGISNTSWFERTEMSNLFGRFFKKFRSSSPTLFEASASAGFDSLRGEGGARQFLRSLAHGGTTSIETSDQQDLLVMEETSKGLETFRGYPTWENFNSLMADYNLMEHFSDPLVSSNQVKVAAILEPLKVRLITKGNELSYYISKFYQKNLWRYLQKFPQFTPTGRPLEIGDFYDLLSREERVLSCETNSPHTTPFIDWVSGDYSSATDNLKISYTKDAFEASLERSGLNGSRLAFILRSVLYEQRLNYPTREAKKGGLDPIDQTTGQLMGSTLSFPMLCVINLCCYWLTLEQYLGRQVQLLDLPVLVNGDDILFRSNPRFYAMWLHNITEVGFTLSLGKNYVHPTFFTINSRGYLYKPSNISEVGYLNVGLLTGQSNVNKRPGDLLPVSAMYNELMIGSQSPYRTHKRFLHYHKDEITKVTNSGEFSLFLSPILAGCGFNLHEAVRPHVHFTYFQTKLARYLYDSLSSYSSTSFAPPSALFFYRTPVNTSINTTTNEFFRRHHGVYGLIPSRQPLNRLQREVGTSNRLKDLNLSIRDTEKTILIIKSFPIKLLEAFRIKLKSSDKFLGSRLPKNRLFEHLSLRLVEIVQDKVKLVEHLEAFDINQYSDPKCQ
jgi:hypothetical protein